eukprot:CAMPEP_0172528226 /NCGR_PEP_ID=MMETSP1067-20121228/2681_1 /TAXON_ID=265564 ORGANISM="Thalassiosira punctigera, Strain Tpunct2005C2" /NCGR_SAMPLE_ID=MMETSP1067 /ASSEMBLY_ACC=CAM_ASM_000444 /LENGTH=165 /DNA_ID=CAMNT_0013312105 /DNA_START=20 /DNA_END=517 /DNA_ORIENTATION=+
MAAKASDQRPRRQLNPLFLSVLASAFFFNTGSAFVPLLLPGIRIASTMSSSSAAAGSSGDSRAEGGEGADAGTSESGALRLPEASGDPSIPSIKLGESIRFEEMGPIIINADGTTRRIDNWDQMTKKEQEVAWRRISKRNEERRSVLLGQQQQQQEGDTGGKTKD